MRRRTSASQACQASRIAPQLAVQSGLRDQRAKIMPSKYDGEGRVSGLAQGHRGDRRLRIGRGEGLESVDLVVLDEPEAPWLL